jgi:hypothetical protein
MALIKQYSKNVYGDDVIFENAYFKICQVSGSKEKVEMNVSIFKDSNKEIAIENKSYEFVPSIEKDASEWIKQGYDYMKTLPEFIEAIDVPEDGSAENYE